MGRRGAPAERFWPKVDRSAGPDACWPWLAGKTKGGYGLFKTETRCVTAHTWAWSSEHGPVPPGLEIDHVRARGCVRHDCCNPAHLEPVTHAENMRRRVPRPPREQCKRGHPLSGANLARNADGKRRCRACVRFLYRARRAGTG